MHVAHASGAFPVAFVMAARVQEKGFHGEVHGKSLHVALGPELIAHSSTHRRPWSKLTPSQGTSCT